MQRVDPDRLGDILELSGAEIADREIEPPLHLTMGFLGETDRAGLGNAFQPRSDIDAIADEIRRLPPPPRRRDGCRHEK